MNTYYIVVHGPKPKSARPDLPHSFYIVHAENLQVAYDKIKIRHKGSRLFVHDKEILKHYKIATWKELG